MATVGRSAGNFYTKMASISQNVKQGTFGWALVGIAFFIDEVKHLKLSKYEIINIIGIRDMPCAHIDIFGRLTASCIQL